MGRGSRDIVPFTYGLYKSIKALVPVSYLQVAAFDQIYDIELSSIICCCLSTYRSARLKYRGNMSRLFNPIGAASSAMKKTVNRRVVSDQRQ